MPPSNAMRSGGPGSLTLFDPSTATASPDRLNTPLSQIKGFPPLSATSPGNINASFSGGTGTSGGTDNSGTLSSPFLTVPGSRGGADSFGNLGDGFNGPESVAFPNLWASMFGIKMNGDALGLDQAGNSTGMGSGYAPGTPLGFGLPMNMTGTMGGLGANVPEMPLGSASAGYGPQVNVTDLGSGSMGMDRI